MTKKKKFHFSFGICRTCRGGFSLVEVVLALGIVSFAGLALVGLFSIGIATNKESIEELEATHAAQSFFAVRRASPLGSNDSSFPLPPLDKTNSVSTNNPLYITGEGAVVSDPKAAKFGMIYRVLPDGKTPGNSKVYVCLYWPAMAAPAKAQGRFETYSLIPRPATNSSTP